MAQQTTQQKRTSHTGKANQSKGKPTGKPVGNKPSNNTSQNKTKQQIHKSGNAPQKRPNSPNLARKKKDSISKGVVTKIENMSEESLTIVGYVAIGIYMAFLIYRYITAILKLQPVVISNNVLIILAGATIPFGIWAYSTKFDRFSFHTQKKIYLYLACGNAIASICQPMIYLSYTYLVSKIAKIEITENMTANMVINLGRLAMIIPLLIAVLLIALPVKEFLTRVEMQESIDNFKITHHVDMRVNKNHLYDLAVMKDLETGKQRVIKEDDRFLHLFINGASGTGKTSSTITPAIANDLDQKIANMKLREEALLEMVKDHRAYVVGPVANITEYNVHPYPKYKDEYREIYKTYPDCGVTVMAPDASLNDDVIKLCEARKIPVNVIDPSKTYDSKYAKKKGINPFYLDLTLSENDKLIAINDAATAFTQVILTANMSQGPGDPYFGEINDSVTTNIAITVMLANSIAGTQTNITEIQQCINNFDDLEPYVSIIEKYYNINVKVLEVSTKNNNNQVSMDALKNNSTAFNANTDEGRDNKYYQTIQFVKQELLGAGKEKMFDQARGLRNLINFILRDPRYMELLSVPQEQAINFNNIFRRCEVTIINTALEFGQKKSTAFGLFNLLNFSIAVKKRLNDEWDMLNPHFLWIDEASQWMHPVYDELINLWRKYKVSGNLAMQSVSQMEKFAATAYLKEVVLKAGTQIVFGRVSAEEMKMYSDLAGLTKEEMIQRTTASSSMFAENASQSVSERTTPNERKNLEGSNIRIRDFQEVSVFTIDGGRVIPGFVAKLNFAPKSAFKKRDVVKVDWKKYLKKKKREVVLTKEAQAIKEEQQTVIKDNATNVTIIETNVEEPKYAVDIDETFDIESIFYANIYEDEPIEDMTLVSSGEDEVEADDSESISDNIESSGIVEDTSTPNDDGPVVDTGAFE